MADNSKEHPTLRKLSDSDAFQLGLDSQDLRGWPVLDHTGRALGTVADLLYKPATAEVVFAAVTIGGRDRLLPIASLVFDEGAKHLLVSRFRSDTTFAAAEPTETELAMRTDYDAPL